MEFLRHDELSRIESEFAGGVTAQLIVEIFKPLGVRLSEATFRKYVQAGLLPRSRRVGRKGKHRGSQGLYPVESIRRINAIKKMMADGMTLEDIKRSFVFVKNHIDKLDRDFAEILDGLAAELSQRPNEDVRRAQLQGELTSLRGRAEALVRDVERLGSALTVRHVEAFSKYTLGA